MDSDLNTYWQTKKVTGRNPSLSEWLMIDLTARANITTVILEWHNNYATSYIIETSPDNTEWITVFSTSMGDGGNDTVLLNSTGVRYVRIVSTAWLNNTFRNWLREIEIQGYYIEQTPTVTPTHTPTVTPTPSPLITAHAGDIDGSSELGRNYWTAAASILIQDTTENDLPGISVSGSWSNGITGDGSCVTDTTGYCTIISPRIKTTTNSVTFTIADVSGSGIIYQSIDNHDPDGDSDGTSILVIK